VPLNCFSRAGIAPVICLLTSISAIASAAGGRDFAGFYHLDNLQNTGNQRQVTLTVRIGNYGDGNLVAGRVVLKCATNPAKNCAAFEAVNIPHGGFFRRTGHFTVDAQDVRHWLKSAPLFLIEDTDPAGRPRQRRIEMLHVHMGAK